MTDSVRVSCALIAYPDGSVPPPPRKPQTIREVVEYEMKKHGEAWEDVLQVACPVDPCTHPMYFDFDEIRPLGGTGEPLQEVPFTIWTEKRCYFPCKYDGDDWASSVPRSPCEEAAESQGGD